MRTKAAYKKFIKKYIEDNDIDFTFEIINTDTATRHTVAEELTDTIAALYPGKAETDEEADIERDRLVTAVYEVLDEEHAEEIENGGRIQILMIAISEDPDEFDEYNNNIWDLAEYLTEYATEEKLKEYEKKYNIVNYREEAAKELNIWGIEDFGGDVDALAEHLINHLLYISNNAEIFAGYKTSKDFNDDAFEREVTRIHNTTYNMLKEKYPKKFK